MLDFEAELDKLLSRETVRLPRYELLEIAEAGREVLGQLNERQNDMSLQIEEIYDLVKEQEGLQKAVEAEKATAYRVALGAIGLADLLEDFCAYAGRSGSEALNHQARLLWEQACDHLFGCGIAPVGIAGQSLDPRLHTVKAGAASPLPREQIVQVLRQGYTYQGMLVRKAAVVVSRGPEEAAGEPEETAWGPEETDREPDRGGWE
ncbi:MAG: nucleotide exchange factor GrpE [Spirochaetaceae bacterium]|jgi:molecular chaperone GrpE (heat shock protein)|nr:nucleotide exchange factor GrpE [Spirochaetaceae bacterium]